MPMSISRRSPLTGQVNVMELNVTQEQLDRFQRRDGLIQNIFPDLSSDEREFILTGYTAEDWAVIFPKGDDDED